MRSIFAYILVLFIRTFSKVFYRLEVKWLTPYRPENWDNTRMVVLLNHTSLYEPLFSQALPLKFLWRFISKMVAPAADKTFNRPLVGTFWKMMIPNASTITRKRDESWSTFLNRIDEKSLIVIAPEGRMKRLTGLDSDGKPMTVRGGIADIIEVLDHGLILVGYSGGLHHVQAPGEHFPRLFKTIKMNFETIDIDEFKKSMPSESRAFKLKVVESFQKRLETNCP